MTIIELILTAQLLLAGSVFFMHILVNAWKNPSARPLIKHRKLKLVTLNGIKI